MIYNPGHLILMMLNFSLRGVKQNDIKNIRIVLPECDFSKINKPTYTKLHEPKVRVAMGTASPLTAPRPFMKGIYLLICLELLAQIG